ncbi:hypothetical protein [Cedratvirus kamchatka]|uniref:Uncharacterized protein n=1 Tax=Cedratvirus kamchatka TaxID=2716914 RepID=A0A6G8MZ82_9VIRU|nr:hypothetical protein [Cedratvirus kamchatka]WIL04383.1 hypothetical protein Clen_453 [Cedratvirus lena]WIL04973.1 hypothetical protein Cduv_493 [Cedratvirus duvanny]
MQAHDLLIKATSLEEKVLSLEEKVLSLEKELSEISSLVKRLVPPQVQKLERNLSKKKEDRIQQLIHAQHPMI